MARSVECITEFRPRPAGDCDAVARPCDLAKEKPSPMEWLWGGFPPPMEWPTQGKTPLFPTIRGQTHQARFAATIPPPNARYVRGVSAAPMQNGKDGMMTDHNCLEKPRADDIARANSPCIVRKSRWRSLEIKAYISKVPCDRSTICELGLAGSVDFEASECPGFREFRLQRLRFVE